MLSVMLSAACVACGDDEPETPPTPDDKTEQTPAGNPDDSDQPGDPSFGPTEENPSEDDPVAEPADPGDPGVGPGEELENRKINVSFTRAGGRTHVDVPVQEFVTEIVRGDAFCTLSPDPSGFTIEVGETLAGTAREAIINLSYAGRTYEISVMQNAFRPGDEVMVGGRSCTVFETTGFSGKVFAALGVSLRWGDSGDFGTSSLSDGYANTQRLMSQTDADVRFPAAYACASVGEGWYLPALNEVVRIGRYYEMKSRNITGPPPPPILRMPMPSTIPKVITTTITSGVWNAMSSQPATTPHLLRNSDLTTLHHL